MKDEFIFGNNFKEYLSEAVSIYVASNFLSRAIIDDIKAKLNELPFSGGKNFRFLVNHDFQEDESMRQILINMLLEIPNTEVRVYEGPKRFHAKLYIFESGNTYFTAIGSFNATAGGAGKSIEAGVKTANREIVREARDFFEKYWDSEYTRIAKLDPNAVYIPRRFRQGDLVIEKSTGEQGVILSDPPELIDKVWFYPIYISGVVKNLSEKNITKQRISYINNETDFIFGFQNTDIETWLSNYLIQKALDLTDNTLLSFKNSRTRTYPYQFRPLFKFLKTKEHRLLIADEVGLGKTIEAGIILKELSARTICKCVLIIVPNALKTKWRDELQVRFDEYIDILSHKDILSFLKDFERAPNSASVKGIISYDQLVNPHLIKFLDRMESPPLFDILIMDEAHHLKNSETKRHKVVNKIARNSKAVVMLTATPIQLKTKDLYNLLAILLPNQFIASDSLAFSGKLTINERINSAVKFLSERNFEEFHKTIDELAKKSFFRRQLEKIGDFDSILQKCYSINEESDRETIRNLAFQIYEYNVLNTYINRTLRKDVANKFPDRSIKTFEYEYTKKEKKLYKSILKKCKENYNNKSAFGAIMPERRAASSLMALKLSYKEENWKNRIEEYWNNYEPDTDNLPDFEDVDAQIEESINDLDGPTEEDSKLEILQNIIEGIYKENSRISHRKILIFCAFRATVHYLKASLKKYFPACYIESMQGEDEIFERDYKRKQFAKNDRPAILVCTEVAGEGLDFQFCRYLINYDMPWNPSKLEQRVGRLDRIGQEAEKITIVNLVNKLTIEDRIMARLFERVKLFNSTIGPLGEILSKYQKEFKTSLLSSERTQEAKEAYEKKVLENIEAKKREQKEFEEKEMVIVGAMDNFYYEKRGTPQFFSSEEVKKLWKFILKKNEFEEKYLINKEAESIYSMIITSETKSVLSEMVEESPIDRFNIKKRKHYKNLIDINYHKNKPIYYTFDQETALNNIKIEQLALTHPFIQGGLKKLSSTFRFNKKALFCSIISENIHKGNYLISIYRFTIINGHTGKKEFVEEQYLCFNQNQDDTPWTLGESIFQELIKNEKIESNSPEDFSDKLNLKREFIKGNINWMAEKILQSFLKISEDRLKIQKKSLKDFYEDKKKQQQQLLKFIHDDSGRSSIRNEISRLDEELQDKLQKLNITDFNITVKCTGILCVEVQ